MCRSHSSVSGHARPRTAEEVKTHSYNALEMNKTESYSVVSHTAVDTARLLSPGDAISNSTLPIAINSTEEGKKQPKRFALDDS